MCSKEQYGKDSVPGMAHHREIVNINLKKIRVDIVASQHAIVLRAPK